MMNYYLEGELIECEVPEGCIDLTGIDFGGIWQLIIAVKIFSVIGL